MFPLLSIFVAIMIGLSYDDVVTEPHPVNLWAIAALMFAVAGVTKLLYDRVTARANATGGSVMMILLRLNALVRVGIVVAYGIIVYKFHWPAVVGPLGISGWVLVDEIVIFAPYFLLLTAVLAAGWSTESSLGLHTFNLRSYLAFHGRQYLLPILPIFCFLAVPDLFDLGYDRGIVWMVEAKFIFSSYPFVQWLTIGMGLFALYCGLPFAMKWFWRAKPLPPGPMRDRLMAFSKRVGFRARDILVWHTEGNVMNAAVIGVAAPVRYVLLTDALLDDLSEDEVEAIFAHEVGHAVHNHMLLFFLFTIGFSLLMFVLGNTFDSELRSLLGESMASGYLYMGFCFLAWFGIIFGFVSRRFEQQADVFAAVSLENLVEGEPAGDPDAHPFVRALEGLSLQMGDIREVTGWRHFSLGDRIGFMRSFIADPAIRKGYRLRMAGLLLGFFGLLGGIGVAAAVTVPDQLRKGKLTQRRLRAEWLDGQGRTGEAFTERYLALIYEEQEGLGRRVDEKKGREVTMARHDATKGSMPAADRAAGLLFLAKGYHAIGEIRPALSALNESMMELQSIGGESMLIYERLGRILEQLDHPEGAVLAYRDSIRLAAPDSPLAAALRARLRELGAVP